MYSKRSGRQFLHKKFENIHAYFDQANIEVHYTESITKFRYKITQGNIDTVQKKRYCPVLRRGMYEFESKDIDVDLF